MQVSCDEGFDGGLPQSFIMEVYETEGHKLKVSTGAGGGDGGGSSSSSSNSSSSSKLSFYP